MNKKERPNQQHHQEIRPLPQRVVPQVWEDLASIISRTTRKMGYESSSWILRPESIPHRVDQAALSRLSRQADYDFLSCLFGLSEERLYSATIHRFTSQFLADSEHSDQTFSAPGRVLLEGEYVQHLVWDTEYARVCPLCLDEAEGYDRLYWRMKQVFLCPRHEVLLVTHCPSCHAPIPSLRMQPTGCPFCQHGDYRRAILALTSEEAWLKESHMVLLQHLGVEQEETGRHSSDVDSQSLLQHLSSHEYFWLLAHLLKLLHHDTMDEYVLPWVLKFLSASHTRLVSTGEEHAWGFPYSLHDLIFLHFLLTSWPSHILFFLERIQQAFHACFHYPQDSTLVLQWAQHMVEGNLWCPNAYITQSMQCVQTMYTAYTTSFENLRPMEVSDQYVIGKVIDGILRSGSIRTITPADAVSPLVWEDITSVISRVASAMGYSRSEWVLKETGTQQRIAVEDIPLLQRHGDYSVLEKCLLLDETSLYPLTLHRFAEMFCPPSLDTRQQQESSSILQKPFLSRVAAKQFFLPLSTIKVCPACVEEQPSYRRLYWRMRYVLVCPHHQLLLIDRCPLCHRLIPTMRRPELARCPYCWDGKYSTALHLPVATNSLLFAAEMWLLRMLGVDEMNAHESLLQKLDGSPLLHLHPWHYFHLLDLFSTLVPHLLPEKTLNRVSHTLGFQYEGQISYQDRGLQTEALGVALFYAFFLDWPVQVPNVLEACLQEENTSSLGSMISEALSPHFIKQQDNDLPQDAETLFLSLQHLFALCLKKAQFARDERHHRSTKRHGSHPALSHNPFANTSS